MDTEARLWSCGLFDAAFTHAQLFRDVLLRRAAVGCVAAHARCEGVPIIGDIEILIRACPDARIVAITGYSDRWAGLGDVRPRETGTDTDIQDPGILRLYLSCTFQQVGHWPALGAAMVASV